MSKHTEKYKKMTMSEKIGHFTANKDIDSDSELDEEEKEDEKKRRCCLCLLICFIILAILFTVILIPIFLVGSVAVIGASITEVLPQSPNTTWTPGLVTI